MQKLKLIKNKNFKGFTYQDYSFLNLKSDEFEIPIGGNHPGSFGFSRKYHIHEGIDIYGQENDIVLSLTNGIIIDINWFTGTKSKENSYWWNNTQYIAIKYKNYVIVYGEILVNENLKIGQKIEKETKLGKIIPVLKKYKNNRPQNMLHIELYQFDKFKTPSIWNHNSIVPNGLLSPMLLFENFFSMEYPNYHDYQFLYKRFIEKEFKFNELKFNYKNKKVLDLCGGQGFLSQNLFDLNANVTYFDESNKMILPQIKNNPKIIKIFGHIKNISMINDKFDYIFCKQAINYWFSEKYIKNIYDLLNKNGVFIFNTFKEINQNQTIYKKYDINNIDYEEISFNHNDKIFHIQKTQQLMHQTIFMNIQQQTFENILNKYFSSIKIIEKNNSILFCCYKCDNYQN